METEQTTTEADTDFLYIDESDIDEPRQAYKPEEASESQRGPIAGILTLCISTFFDYLRWTQLTPMVLLWGFMIIMLVLTGLLSFQDQSVELGRQLSEVTAKVPGLNDKLIDWYDAIFSSATKTEDGGMEWKDGQMTAGILKVWGYLSLVLFVLGIAYSFLFKRTVRVEPTSLRKKLGICAMAAAAVVTVFFAIDHFSEMAGNNQDPRLHFVGYGFLLWLVSAYSLTASHFLGWLSDKISMV